MIHVFGTLVYLATQSLSKVQVIGQSLKSQEENKRGGCLWLNSRANLETINAQ